MNASLALSLLLVMGHRLSMENTLEVVQIVVDVLSDAVRHVLLDAQLHLLLGQKHTYARRLRLHVIATNILHLICALTGNHSLVEKGSWTYLLPGCRAGVVYALKRGDLPVSSLLYGWDLFVAIVD